MGAAGYGGNVFTKAILEGRPIDVYNNGDMERDFTYVDDVTEGVVRVLAEVAVPEAARVDTRSMSERNPAPYRL